MLVHDGGERSFDRLSEVQSHPTLGVQQNFTSS